MTPNTTQHNLETAIGFYDRSKALSHIKGFETALFNPANTYINVTHQEHVIAKVNKIYTNT